MIINLKIELPIIVHKINHFYIKKSSFKINKNEHLLRIVLEKHVLVILIV